jgi:amino acid transporter
LNAAAPRASFPRDGASSAERVVGGTTMSSTQAEEPRKRAPLPAGYRQGIISAITVLLGFSLLFLRYYSFEAPGDWTIASTIAALLLALAILLELIALWRSLRIEDDDEPEYRVTLRWFVASVGILLASLLLAALATSHVFNL